MVYIKVSDFAKFISNTIVSNPSSNLVDGWLTLFLIQSLYEFKFMAMDLIYLSHPIYDYYQIKNLWILVIRKTNRRYIIYLYFLYNLIFTFLSYVKLVDKIIFSSQCIMKFDGPLYLFRISNFCLTETSKLMIYV